MIGYVTIGTNDVERAVHFYDARLSTVGVKRLWKTNSMAAWGPSRQGPRGEMSSVVDGGASKWMTCVCAASKSGA